MVTIKEIAKECGYSVTTVSIVLRGDAEKRSISKETQKAITEAAQRMGYAPNVSARRLRSDAAPRKSIAVFWADDFRAVMVAKFLQGVEKYIQDTNADFEIIVRPYSPNHLEKNATVQNLNMYAGGIICNASKHDLEYIEGIETLCPIVLYNRESSRYFNVIVDNHAIGQKAAEVLLQAGCENMAIITSNKELTYDAQRIEGFAKTCLQNKITSKIIFVDDTTIAEGGKSIDKLPLEEGRLGVFACSDMLAFGLLKSLNKNGIEIPGQVSLISVGTSETEIYQCLQPSLSVIEIPIVEMAYACMSTMNNALIQKPFQTRQDEVPFTFLPAKSTQV